MTRETAEQEASAYTKFRLLMWKNFLQQWRNRKQTLSELLLPVFIMAIVVLIRWLIRPIETNTTLKYPPISSHSLNFSIPVLLEMNITEMSIAYSPSSPELDEVVRSAVTNLMLQNIPFIFPIIEDILPELQSDVINDFFKDFIKIDVYNNSRELRDIYNNEHVIRKVIAAVEFDDNLYGVTELPIDISYFLRFPERPRLYTFYSDGGNSWRTDSIFPTIDVAGPRFPGSWEGGNDPGYVNEMFIALQNAISLEIISRITGEDVRNFTIDLQRYPHPPYVNDMATNLLEILIPLLLVVSYSYTASYTVNAITIEKELQLKETMKIMGLPTWLHWTAWFCKQFIVLLISTSLIVALLKINWFTNEEGITYAVISNTPWTVLMFFLIMYAISIIFFCFMISCFFSSATTAVMFAEFIWVLSGLPAILLTLLVDDISPTAQAFTCLLINCAAVFGLQMIFGKESSGGMQWGEFMTPESGGFLFGHVIIMLAVNCVLYMSIALYVEQVLPGPYGTSKPWYFLFTADFWCPARAKIRQVAVTPHNNYEVLKEGDPADHTVGVKINNLTKVFGPNLAVDKLSLNIFDDQITVLLGHNGAGKSTTISMLTGNLKSTDGSVILAGYNIGQQLERARSHIGLCPQHDVLFQELTVKEHLQFYAKLKGFKGEQLEEDIESLIEKIELQDKRDCKAMGLSGGQKRRLCVGIALSGAARVILLDEPTSGMDPAARRSLWELLQKEKKGRSMILTTHFMDEADYLGDRVAIMAHGRLQCVGSPNFLKRHHGMGYTLVVVKDEGFDYDRCVRLINTYIPNTPIKEDRGSEINFHLNNEDSHVFEAMLDDFEKNINQIKFKNYGLIATTLEDVFMKVGADASSVSTATSNGTSTEDSIEELSTETEDYATMSNIRQLFHHVRAVWMKLYLVSLRSWGVSLMQLLLPLIIVNFNLTMLSVADSFIDDDTVQSRRLTLAEGFSFTETLVNYVGTSPNELGAQAHVAYQDKFRDSDVPNMDLTVVGSGLLEDYYLDRATETSNAMDTLRHTVLIGATFDDASAVAWFSNFGYHDVAISLNAVHSALLRAKNAVAQLNVYNYPLEASYQEDLQTTEAVQIQLSIAIGTSVAIIAAVFVKFYIKERVSGAKLLQQAAGLQPIVMWGSALVFDWLWFLFCCVSIIISCFAFKVVGFSTASELARLFLCITVYGATMLPLNYLFSLMFKGPGFGNTIVFFINFFFGVIGALLIELLAPLATDVFNIIDMVLQFFPMYAFSASIMSLSSDSGNGKFNWVASNTLRYLIAMLISGAVFFIVLMIIEYRLLHTTFRRKKVPEPVDPRTIEKDVADEEFHVNRIDKANLSQHGLVTKGLSKYYGKNLAVNQISFSVNEAECFGLLGVNGAGKTTTFKMLMGDESISSGEAYVSGHSVQTELTKAYKKIGYCPQEMALFPQLTGRETLRLFSLLRGAPAARPQADRLAHALGIEKHLDKKVDQYSGGTKRKLNTAIALLGPSRLVFVDEPTSGVDPAAKRQIWSALRNVQKSGRGVLLTSHSMEECEALCSRLTIMVNGRFQCLGTPQHLKNKYSEGYTLIIKLKQDRDSLTLESATEAIKQYVNNHFVDSKIMEEYQGILTFYLKDSSMAWSKMFGIMERAKRDFSVEYYNISQTTLEQIFLQFTKYQNLK